MILEISSISVATLLPILLTLIAEAIDPKNKEISGSKFCFKAKEIIDNIASPAPTLSTELFINAGQ